MASLGAFILSLGCAAVLTPVVNRLARRAGALDDPRSTRKVHSAPTPRLGGIAIVTAFAGPLVALVIWDPDVARLFAEDGLRPWGLFAGAAIIAALGVYDDLRGANAKVKLTVQLAAAALVYSLGYRIHAIANPFGDSIQLGWLGLPFTALWIAGVTNAMNLIDGLDGLAGGVALVAVAATFLFGAHDGSPLTMLLCACLGGALVGFLRYNFNPASIFMGDSGSMFLGFVLAATAITAHHHSSGVAILNPILLLGVPIADTLLAMARRGLRGVPLFQSDRGHIHHRLLDLGLSHRGAVLVLYAASALLGATALALTFASRDHAAVVLAVVGAGAALALRSLGFLRLEDAAGLLERRQLNISRRTALRAAATRLRDASAIAHVWEGVKDARAALGAESAALRLHDHARHRDRRFAHGEASGEVVRVRHRLATGPREAAVLEFGWLASTPVDRDIELAVEQFSSSVQAALARVVGLSAPVSIELAAHPADDAFGETAEAASAVNAR